MFTFGSKQLRWRERREAKACFPPKLNYYPWNLDRVGETDYNPIPALLQIDPLDNPSFCRCLPSHHPEWTDHQVAEDRRPSPKQFRKCVHAACVVRASVLSGWSAVSYAGRSDNPGSDDHPRDQWVQESPLPRPCHLAKSFPPIVWSYANNKRVIYCCFILSGTWYLLELIELKDGLGDQTSRNPGIA